MLQEQGAHGSKVAAVDGSLITDRVLELTDTVLENGQPTSSLAPTLISAEACLGAEPVVEALRAGAQIVVTGRVADPSLFLAPMMFEFGWDPLDHERIGAGNAIGHLLECGDRDPCEHHQSPHDVRRYGPVGAGDRADRPGAVGLTR